MLKAYENNVDIITFPFAYFSLQSMSWFIFFPSWIVYKYCFWHFHLCWLSFFTFRLRCKWTGSFQCLWIVASPFSFYFLFMKWKVKMWNKSISHRNEYAQLSMPRFCLLVFIEIDPLLSFIISYTTEYSQQSITLFVYSIPLSYSDVGPHILGGQNLLRRLILTIRMVCYNLFLKINLTVL